MTIPLRPADILEDDRLLDRLAERDGIAPEQVGSVLAALAAHADQPLPARGGPRRRFGRHRALTALAVLAVGASGAGVAAAMNGPGWTGPRPQHSKFAEGPDAPGDTFVAPAPPVPGADETPPAPRAETPTTVAPADEARPRRWVVDEDGAVSYAGVRVSAVSTPAAQDSGPGAAPGLLAETAAETSAPPWRARPGATDEPEEPRGRPTGTPRPGAVDEGSGPVDDPMGQAADEAPPTYTFAPTGSVPDEETGGGLSSASVGVPTIAPPGTSAPSGPPSGLPEPAAVDDLPDPRGGHPTAPDVPAPATVPVPAPGGVGMSEGSGAQPATDAPAADEKQPRDVVEPETRDDVGAGATAEAPVPLPDGEVPLEEALDEDVSLLP